MTEAATYWGAKQGYAPNWYSFCARTINARITGNPDLAPSMWALRHVLGAGPAKHLLEIGCLDGKKPANFKTAGLAIEASGVDYAEAAILRGQEQYGAEISLSVMDLNEPALPAQTFDIILANGVLHHIANLEACVQNLYDALMPGGALIASDFTGPRRYAYSAREIALINEGVAMLPEPMRVPFDPAVLAPKLAADPSERITTRDIPDVIRATFDQVETIPYGGNVLMRALPPKAIEGFDPENPEHVSALEALSAFDHAVSSREPSHHHYVIARRAQK